MVSELDSRSKGCGFESRLIQHTRWKWGKSHARIDSCTQFWLKLKIQKNVGSQMRHTDKKILEARKLVISNDYNIR